jgi:hypothetical protein
MGINELTQVIRLVFGAMCTFFAILLSSKTREPSWVLIIIGVMCMYVQVVVSTLDGFGILDTNISILGLPVLRILLENIPLIFLTIGFILALAKKSKY